jgi:U3 small nucleolar RNA-associated protein 14
MAKAQEVLYAVVGAGDFAVDKVKGIRKVADRKRNEKLYKDFVKRGRTLSTQVKNSKPGKQVRTGTEVAKEQLNDAAKNVGKAIGVNVVSWPKTRRSSARKSTASKSTARKSTGTKKNTRKTTAAAS